MRKILDTTNRFSAQSIFNADFLFCFLAALLEHMFWNSGILTASITEIIIKFVAMLTSEWLITLSITRKCLKQAVLVGSRPAFQQDYSVSTPGMGKSGFAVNTQTTSHLVPYIIGLTGEFSGQKIMVPAKGIRIGRDNSCDIILRNTASISRQHCLLRFDSRRQVFVAQDLNSSYGTFLGNGTKIPPAQSLILRPGGFIYLVSPDVLSFRVELL